MENTVVAPKQRAALKHPLYQWALYLVGSAVFFYFFPLFHIEPLSKNLDKKEEVFNAKQYADEFWQGSLLSATKQAVDISLLIEQLDSNPEKAAEQFGHRLGLSNTTSYLVQGQGTVHSLSEDQVILALPNNNKNRLSIEIGPIFSNAVRDATGLLNISQFSNTQEYNALSSELNLKVERLIEDKLQTTALEVGSTIKFSAAIELTGKAPTTSILSLIPVYIEVL